MRTSIALFTLRRIGLTLIVPTLMLILGGGPLEKAAWGQEQPGQGPRVSPDKAQRRQQLLEQLNKTQRELKELDEEREPAPVTAAPVATKPSKEAEAPKEESALLEPVEVLASRIERNPAGRAIGKIEREEIEPARGFDLKELLEATPGVFSRQGNGPRDVNISIRGSGAKTTFGVQNLKTYEDWFPTTQSDGLSRTDINDPHAYEGMDVLRGPSSALYDNYALGGVINFRTQRGRDIRGGEVGNDVGSFGYHNHYVQIGDQHKYLEYSLFGSYIQGDGFIDNSQFHTSTENLLATITPDDKRSLTLKFLNNDLDAKTPSRLTLAELRANPRDAGRTFVTGKGFVTAEQAAQGRQDRRTIVGARYEQALDASTGFRVLGEYDVKDINQTFFAVIDNVNPNFNFYTDLTHEATVWGLNAKHYIGLFFNHMDQEGSQFLNLADFKGTRGALQSQTRGTNSNFGGRLREEIQFDSHWTGVLGVGVESSDVTAQVRTRTAPETFSVIDVDRSFMNVAPEAVLIYRYSPELRVHGRVATGYGTPAIGQLTTTSSGLTGNNTDLKAQENVGLELGMDWRPFPTLALNLTGYYEFFFNEFITQSPGAGLSAFTSNAPRAEHRGVELALDWRPFEGWRLSSAYTFNDHVYKEFLETIGAGVTLDRSGKQIPGVERHILNAKLGYESRYHLGGWIEVNCLSDFFVNNSNTLKAEGYQVANVNLHYSRDLPEPYIRGVTAFFEIQNLFDVDYIASANVVADTPTDTPANLATTKQAFFAGPERSFWAGLKLKF